MSFKFIKYKLDSEILRVSEQIKGGNSYVYKGHSPSGMTVAIKEYIGDKFRIEQMLSREVESIKFLRSHGIKNIPKIIEIQHELGVVIYQWIEGKESPPNSKSIDDMVNFCILLKEIYSLGSSFANSIDAVFSLSELESQILDRIQGLENSFRSLEVNELCGRFREKLSICITMKKEKSFINRTFSVSDLGTHNMINSKGNNYFIDFEFFGLDSVNKMIGDFILHPKNRFTQNDITRFVSKVSRKFEWDSDELKQILPLLTLKWALITYARTFKEEFRNGNMNISNVAIDKSLGTKYLKYFDQWEHIGSHNLAKSFNTFYGTLDNL